MQFLHMQLIFILKYDFSQKYIKTQFQVANSILTFHMSKSLIFILHSFFHHPALQTKLKICLLG